MNLAAAGRFAEICNMCSQMYGVPHLSAAADIFYIVNYYSYFKVLYKLLFPASGHLVTD
jgi:hypothetical protein